MKRKIGMGFLKGFPLGIAIGYVITIFMSLIVGDGGYHPVSSLLVAEVGGELNAVMVQTLLSGILGGVSFAAAMVWDLEHWGLARRTAVYYLALALALFPIAYLAHWMERTLLGFFIYASFFVVISVIIWLAQYLFWKVRIDVINKKVCGKG